VGKKSREKSRAAAAVPEGAAGEVGPRQPCPCGSGRRYKACHGQASGAPPVWSARPFAGLAGECDLIAMREFVPAATAPVRVVGDDRRVTLATLLPGAVPALVRADGDIWLGLQVQHAYGDPSRDLAAVLEAALAAEPGTTVGLTTDPGEGPKFQDLVEGDLAVTVHDGFGYWLDGLEDADGSMAAVVEQADEAVAASVRLEAVASAYWTEAGDREFLRWVRPEDEDALLDALARLHAAGSDRLVEGGRLIGMFRAHGVLAPVWDLPAGTGAAALEEPLRAFDALLADALADGSPLGAEARSARSGLASRQVTLR
jgi:hypothetical protein